MYLSCFAIDSDLMQLEDLLNFPSKYIVIRVIIVANKIITEIPATKFQKKTGHSQKELRVAAYCRVSTEEEEQLSSFETQTAYYRDKIAEHDGWRLAGIFADEGISGVHTKKRTGFLQMIAQCKAGNIDLILTKSISRFARNTLDSIQYIRMLKGLNVAVYFEKENINTSTMTSEMMLTVLSAFAQAESESISKNVKWGIRRGYKQGKFTFQYSNMLGYQKGKDGHPQIIPEEAEIIQLIYFSYLDGKSLGSIADLLNEKQIPTPSGKSTWNTQGVLRILQNERYAGDVLLQKTFRSDLLNGTTKKNNGELPQYYIKDNHKGIVSHEVFQKVQEEIARRKSKSPHSVKNASTNKGRFSSKYALTDRLVCGNCGCHYRRVTWNIHGRKQIVWRCISRLEYGKQLCPNSPSIPESSIQAAIVSALQKIGKECKPEALSSLRHSVSISKQEDEITANAMRRLKEAQEEFSRLLSLYTDDLDNDNDRGSVPMRQIAALNDEILQLKQILQQADAKQVSNRSDALTQEFIQLASSTDFNATGYSDTLVIRTIEKITVLSHDKIRIRFMGGYAVEEELL